MYNNYGYNPYGRYQQPMVPTQMSLPQSPVMSGQNNIIPTNSPLLNGKMVESEDVVKATEIPLDGSISYFPLADGSKIITKQLQNDGTSKITVFKPFTEEKEKVKYITQEELKNAIEGIDLSEIDDIKEDIKDIKKQLKKKSEKDE